MWSRVEGSRCDPNPNEEFARPDGESLFGRNGKLTPSITILGEKDAVPMDKAIVACLIACLCYTAASIILPHERDLSAQQ